MTAASPSPLTPNEKAFLEYIEKCFLEKGFSPSYQEICQHFGWSSFNSVQNYLKRLKAKGYLEFTPHAKRAIQLKHSSFSQMQMARTLRNPMDSKTGGISSVPLLGKVAAGQPLEAHAHGEFVDVPASMARDPHATYALQVVGASMKDEGILDGDILIVRRKEVADNGDLVIATLDNESTVKRFYLRRKQGAKWVELKPANSDFQSQWYPAERVRIQGHVIGLVRQFL